MGASGCDFWAFGVGDNGAGSRGRHVFISGSIPGWSKWCIYLLAHTSLKRSNCPSLCTNAAPWHRRCMPRYPKCAWLPALPLVLSCTISTPVSAPCPWHFYRGYCKDAPSCAPSFMPRDCKRDQHRLAGDPARK